MRGGGEGKERGRVVGARMVREKEARKERLRDGERRRRNGGE